MPSTGPERRPTRAGWHDYGEPRSCFMTIVAQFRICRFGSIRDMEMLLSAAGKMVVEVWTSLSERPARIVPEAMVLMPNHLQAIVRVGAAKDEDQPSLPQAIGWLRSVTTTRYARDVRSSEEQAMSLRYIERNPGLWSEDTFHEPETDEPVGVQILPVLSSTNGRGGSASAEGDSSLLPIAGV